MFFCAGPGVPAPVLAPNSDYAFAVPFFVVVVDHTKLGLRDPMSNATGMHRRLLRVMVEVALAFARDYPTLVRTKNGPMAGKFAFVLPYGSDSEGLSALLTGKDWAPPPVPREQHHKYDDPFAAGARLTGTQKFELQKLRDTLAAADPPMKKGEGGGSEGGIRGGADLMSTDKDLTWEQLQDLAPSVPDSVLLQFVSNVYSVGTVGGIDGTWPIVNTVANTHGWMPEHVNVMVTRGRQCTLLLGEWDSNNRNGMCPGHERLLAHAYRRGWMTYQTAQHTVASLAHVVRSKRYYADLRLSRSDERWAGTEDQRREVDQELADEIAHDAREWGPTRPERRADAQEADLPASLTLRGDVVASAPLDVPRDPPPLDTEDGMRRGNEIFGSLTPTTRDGEVHAAQGPNRSALLDFLERHPMDQLWLELVVTTKVVTQGNKAASQASAGPDALRNEPPKVLQPPGMLACLLTAAAECEGWYDLTWAWARRLVQFLDPDAPANRSLALGKQIVDALESYEFWLNTLFHGNRVSIEGAIVHYLYNTRRTRASDRGTRPHSNEIDALTVKIPITFLDGLWQLLADTPSMEPLATVDDRFRGFLPLWPRKAWNFSSLPAGFNLKGDFPSWPAATADQDDASHAWTEWPAYQRAVADSIGNRDVIPTLWARVPDPVPSGFHQYLGISVGLPGEMMEGARSQNQAKLAYDHVTGLIPFGRVRRAAWEVPKNGHMRYRPLRPTADRPADLSQPIDQEGTAHPDGVVVAQWPDPRPPLPATTWAAAVCGLTERTNRSVQSSKDWYVNFARAVGGFADILPALNTPIPDTDPWPSLSFGDGTVPVSRPPREAPKAPPPQRRVQPRLTQRPAPTPPPATPKSGGIARRMALAPTDRTVPTSTRAPPTRQLQHPIFMPPQTKAKSAATAPPPRSSPEVGTEASTSVPSHAASSSGASTAPHTGSEWDPVWYPP